MEIEKLGATTGFDAVRKIEKVWQAPKLIGIAGALEKKSYHKFQNAWLQQTGPVTSRSLIS